jgi:hypothetical protein
MRKIIFLAITITFFITSCKKHDDAPACTTDTASVSGSYKITAVTYKESATAAEVDYFNILFDACERDDIYTFQANGTYQITDAGMVCSPSGNDNGIWSLSGSTMTIDGDANAIESFDCKALVFVNQDVQVTGDKLKLTLTKQ